MNERKEIDGTETIDIVKLHYVLDKINKKIGVLDYAEIDEVFIDAVEEQEEESPEEETKEVKEEK